MHCKTSSVLPTLKMNLEKHGPLIERHEPSAEPTEPAEPAEVERDVLSPWRFQSLSSISTPAASRLSTKWMSPSCAAR